MMNFSLLARVVRPLLVLGLAVTVTGARESQITLPCETNLPTNVLCISSQILVNAWAGDIVKVEFSDAKYKEDFAINTGTGNIIIFTRTFLRGSAFGDYVTMEDLQSGEGLAEGLIVQTLLHELFHECHDGVLGETGDDQCMHFAIEFTANQESCNHLDDLNESCNIPEDDPNTPANEREDWFNDPDNEDKLKTFQGYCLANAESISIWNTPENAEAASECTSANLNFSSTPAYCNKLMLPPDDQTDPDDGSPGEVIPKCSACEDVPDPTPLDE